MRLIRLKVIERGRERKRGRERERLRNIKLKRLKGKFKVSYMFI